jgi:hypothetical protein
VTLNNDPAAEKAPECPTKIVVGELTFPLIELSVYDCDPAAPLRPLQIDESIVRTIGDVLRILPGAAAAGIQASSTTYMLRFAPDIAARLGSGTATLMQSLNCGVRAIAVGANGQIIGNGTLVAAQGLGSIATATLLWQTLALVTAQHYLHDMQKQLHSISDSVHELKNWLLLKEQSLILGHERYLQRIVRTIQSGVIQELDLSAISGQIEQIERECDQVQEMMRLIMERQYTRLSGTQISGWFHWDVQSNVLSAQGYVEDFNHAAYIFAAAVRVKGMLAAFRTHIFLQVQISNVRLEEARADRQRGHALVAKLYNRVDQRLNDVWATTDMFNVLGTVRQAIREGAAQYRRNLRNEFGRLDTELKTTQHYIVALNERRQAPRAIVIKRDADGQLLTYLAPEDTVLSEQGLPAAQ